MKLSKTEHIVGVWAEKAAGPGWSNQLVWVCIRDQLDGSYRVDALQPDEQTKMCQDMFSVFHASFEALMFEVVAAVHPKVRKRKG